MRTTRRRRLEPEIRRLEIIEAAERLLIMNGPEVRVEDVVREAGVAKGTFYLYFPTWDDLLEVIRGRLVAAFDEAHPLRIETATAKDLASTLDWLAVAFVDAIIAMGGLHAVLFHTDFARRRPIPEADNPINRLTVIVRVGRETGAFADVDVPLTGRLLFAVVHETADAVAAGEDRERALAAMRWMLRRAIEREVR